MSSELSSDKYRDDDSYSQSVDYNSSRGRRVSTNRSSNSSSRDMARKVDPMSVRSAAMNIVKKFDGQTSPRHVAEIHRYVNENISYVSDPASTNYIAPPEETLETGAGDCDCQATLVASLLESVGMDTRMALCKSTDGSAHMLAEVRLADNRNETSEVANALRSYYSSIGYPYSNFSYDADSDGFWYPVDTAMGRYVGDIEQLSDNGYIIRQPGGSWYWNDADYHYP